MWGLSQPDVTSFRTQALLAGCLTSSSAHLCCATCLPWQLQAPLQGHHVTTATATTARLDSWAAGWERASCSQQLCPCPAQQAPTDALQACPSCHPCHLTLRDRISPSQVLAGTFQLLCGVLPGWSWCSAQRRGTTAVLEVKLEVEKVPGFRGSDLIRGSSSQGR